MEMRLFIVILAGLATLAQAAPPDVVIHHAKIFSGVAGRPFAEAIAIRGDRIVAVGSNEQVLKTADASTRSIDGAGRVVVPGFNDAHMHINPQPPMVPVAVNGQEPSWAEVRSALQDAIAKSPSGPMLIAIIGGRVLEDRDANRETLDAISASRPIRLDAWTGHGTILNSAALRLYNIRDDQSDPPGGFHGRGAGGRLDGRLYEYAEFPLSLPVDEKFQAEAWPAILGQLAAFGITTVQNMTFAASRDRAYFAKQAPAIRTRIMPMITNWAEAGGAPVEPHEAVKIIVDGTPVERFAAMRQPYTDDSSTSGRMNLSEAELCRALRSAAAAHRQLLLHVVGDRAVLAAVACMEAQPEVDWPRERVRFEHGDMVTPELFARVRRLGVIVVQNPSHFTIADVLNARWGRDRAAVAQSAKSLIDAGIPFALGSDGPPSPFLNIMLACMHPARPAEALSREQAVEAYTRGAAFAEFTEADKGTLEGGKLADLAMLSQDIFTVALPELPKTESLLTLVGGRIVHEAK
jgi:predicted amidohydrolase YtcJ